MFKQLLYANCSCKFANLKFKTMKRLIYILAIGFALAACGSKGGDSKTELTPEQELQSVDSATQETNARLDELDKSVDDLQKEVDSLLNVKK
jgi:predicted small lipoprotein YifL